jgi:hypothetical protein
MIKIKPPILEDKKLEDQPTKPHSQIRLKPQLFYKKTRPDYAFNFPRKGVIECLEQAKKLKFLYFQHQQKKRRCKCVGAFQSLL